MPYVDLDVIYGFLSCYLEGKQPNVEECALLVDALLQQLLQKYPIDSFSLVRNIDGQWMYVFDNPLYEYSVIAWLWLLS